MSSTEYRALGDPELVSAIFHFQFARVGRMSLMRRYLPLVPPAPVAAVPSVALSSSALVGR